MYACMQSVTDSELTWKPFCQPFPGCIYGLRFCAAFGYGRADWTGAQVVFARTPAGKLGRGAVLLRSSRSGGTDGFTPLRPAAKWHVQPAAMALKKVKGSIDRIFDKNLQDLVRGIRNHKDDEVKVIIILIITNTHVYMHMYFKELVILWTRQ